MSSALAAIQLQMAGFVKFGVAIHPIAPFSPEPYDFLNDFHYCPGIIFVRPEIPGTGISISVFPEFGTEQEIAAQRI